VVAGQAPEAVTPSPASGPRAAVALIRQRNFGLYFIGTSVSASGTWFQNLAASLLVFRLTGSAFLLGVVSFAQFVPVLVLAPAAGVLADRFDRRRVVVVVQFCNAAAAASLAAFAALGLASPTVIILITLGMGAATALGAAAAEALVVSLVEPAELATAIGLKSMTYNLARVAGPAAAGLTVAAIGIPPAFAINAGSYLILAIAILFVRPRLRMAPIGESRRFRDVVDVVRRTPGLASLLLVVAAVGFAADPLNTLAPAFAHAFGRQDTQAGLLIGIYGCGAVAAALTLSGRVDASSARLHATLALAGGGMVLFAFTPRFVPALLCLLVAGFGYLAANTAATSRLQLSVADEHRGRIMALWAIAFLGLRPIASLIDGSIAAGFGVRAAGVALGLPAIAVAVFLALRRH
jgi:MFS family permease